MAEATDDSYIFARTLVALRYFVLLMERFQFAYGRLTQWSKTVAYVLNPTDEQKRITLPSISLRPGASPFTIAYHPVPLIKDKLKFLGASVDDPSSRYNSLRDFVNNFRFLRFSRCPPITIIRRICHAMRDFTHTRPAIDATHQGCRCREAGQIDREESLRSDRIPLQTIDGYHDTAFGPNGN